MTTPFNPLDVSNIGVTLAIELLEQPHHPLPPPDRFPGAGVYALYYRGPFEPYAPLSGANQERLRYPIYFGSALREGVKKGFRSTPEIGPRVHDRLKDHAGSIRQATNLDLGDFSCRYLVLDDAFILLAESVLIRIFNPVWNGLGFGSKVVGKFRMGGLASPWDTLHPGRGGRPAAPEERQQRLRTSVVAQLSQLGQRPSDDDAVGRMYDRIVKFL